MSEKQTTYYITGAGYFFLICGIVFGLLTLVMLFQAVGSMSYSAGLDDALTLATLIFAFLAFMKRFPKPARITFVVLAILSAFLVGKI